MLVFVSTPTVSVSPTPQQIADLRLAASQMTGATRRAFQAEMALKYCEGQIPPNYVVAPPSSHGTLAISTR